MKTKNIEKGIRQLPDGRYKVFIKRRLGDGRVFRKSRIARNLPDARKAKEQLVVELNKFCNGDPDRSFSSVADEWIEHYFQKMKSKGSALSPTSQGDYQSAVNVLKRVVPANIRTLDEIGIYNLIDEQFVSNGRKRKIRSILNMILQYAIHLRILSHNPCANVRYKKEFTKAPQLSPEDAAIFLKRARSDRWQYYPVTFLAFYLGMRSGELRALKRSSIDFKYKLIHIHESLTTAGTRKLPKNGKTREFPLTNAVSEFLKEHLSKIQGNDIFPKEDYPALYRGELSKDFKIRCKFYGLPPVKFHSARGTCATYLLLQGVDPLTAAYLTGHEDLDTFYDHYVADIKDMERARVAAEKLDYEKLC